MKQIVMRRGLSLLAAGILFFAPALRAQVTLQADGPGNTYELIDSKLGGGAEEVPDCSDPGFGRHITEDFDDILGKNVFIFHIHVTPDNDRCVNFDRQRNEIKTYGPSPAYLKGFYGDVCSYRWKFKLDAAFQPSPNFCHIHQIKAGDGSDADSPLMTITPRYASPERLEIIYTAPAGLSGSGTKATATLSNFKGQWIEAFEQVLYATNGVYQLTLRRVSDGFVLLSYTNNNLNMWRGDATFNRPKWGIYRSLNSSNYLRDEQVRFADFCLAKGSDICPSDIGLPPPFTLSAAPTAQTINAGIGTSYTVTVMTNAGFSGTVSLAVTNGLPANASAVFSPASLNGSGTSTLSVTTATNTPAGSYTLVIRGTNSALTTNTTVSLVVASPGSDLVWNSISSTAWDTSTANWFNEQTSAADFFQTGKKVLFTDRAGVVTNVTIASGVAVSPAAMTVNAELSSYIISGAGKITGTNGLVKTGGGTLTLGTTNDFIGVVTLGGGVVSVPVLANGGSASSIGAGTSDPTNLVFDGGALQWTGGASITVNRGFTITTNGGTLDASPPTQFILTLSGAIAMSGLGNRSLTLAGTDPNALNIGGNVISSVISNGPGGVTSILKQGNNAWNLTAANTFSGGIVINAGRVRANTSAAAFGTGAVTVNDGAQAYCNVGATFPNAFFLEGIGIPEPDGNFGALRLAQNGATVTNTITLTGNARISARGATAAGALISGRITGDGSLEFGNSGGGTAAGVLTLSNGSNAWSGDTIISHGALKLGAAGSIPHGAESGNTYLNNSNPTNNSTLDLNGFSPVINGLSAQGPDLSRCIVTNSSVTSAMLTVGDNNASGSFGAAIKNGAGIIALTKIGAGVQILGGTNTCTGATVISNGTLIVNGSLASTTVTVMNGATLGGNGILGGGVTVNVGGIIAPGNSTGILTINNSVTLRGTTIMELNRTAHTNDVLRSTTTISYGGTLLLTNLSGTLTTGDSFRLFDAASYSGGFTNIIPAIPGINLAWNTNGLTNGILSIGSSPTPSPKIEAVYLAGNNFILSGSNGVANWPCYLLATTNLGLPASQWPCVATDMFDGDGNFIITNTCPTNSPQQYFLLQLQ
jgi:autotransporter-associated beta strand protein